MSKKRIRTTSRPKRQCRKRFGRLIAGPKCYFDIGLRCGQIPGTLVKMKNNNGEEIWEHIVKTCPDPYGCGFITCEHPPLSWRCDKNVKAQSDNPLQGEVFVRLENSFEPKIERACKSTGPRNRATCSETFKQSKSGKQRAVMS